MLVAAVCALVVLVALALLALPVLRLWRQTKALSRTVAEAGERVAAVAAGLPPPGGSPGRPSGGTVERGNDRRSTGRNRPEPHRTAARKGRAT